MKKWLKIALISVAVLVVLLVVVVAVVVASLDSIVKAGVEQGGSYALKVPVKLESAKISIFKGRASLTGFSVANPPGFSSAPALAFGEVTAEIKPMSVKKDPVDIPEIVVRQPAVAIESSVDDALSVETNVGVLKKNLDQTIAGLSSGKGGEQPAAKPPDKPAPAPAAAPQAPAKRIRLDHLVLENPQVNLSAKLLGQTQQKSIVLGKVEFTGLAKQYPNGLTASELTKMVLDRLLNEAMKDKGDAGAALKRLIDKGAMGTLKSIGDDATKMGTDILKDPTKATEIIKDPKKAAEGLKDVKDMQDTGKGLKDMFKKK